MVTSTTVSSSKLDRFLSERKFVIHQTIVTFALQLISNEVRDRETATFCEKPSCMGTFGNIPKIGLLC